jgi:hypothetical protein
MQLAPPASYSLANSAGSTISERSPLDGLDLFTSAITATPASSNIGNGSKALGTFLILRSKFFLA